MNNFCNLTHNKFKYMFKSKSFLILLLIPLFLIASCTKQSEETLLSNAKVSLEEAKKLESENKVDEAKAKYLETIDIYKTLITDYPNSQYIPDAYNAIAKIYIDNLKDYPSAVKYYTELYEKYPDKREAKYAMFMVAFIYDEMLKDKQNAIVHYKIFLEKYPQDQDPNEKMSESARMMLQLLESGTTVEDIIKRTNVSDSTNKSTDKTSKDTTKVKEAPKPGPGPKPEDKNKDTDINKQQEGTSTPPKEVKPK